MKKIICIGMMWLLGSSQAFAGKYETCDIINGEVTYCHGWFSGKSVVKNNGRYETCDIINGEVTYCHGWFSGKSVAKK